MAINLLSEMTQQGASSRKRALVAFVLGAFGALALPPLFLLPMLAVSVCGWFILLQTAPGLKQVLWMGWLWGLGYFMAGLYWMCISLLVDPERFAWMIPFCLIGLNGVIALYPALASAAWWIIAQRARLEIFPATLLFVLCWSISEYARSHLFTGFPWNLPGHVWAVWAPAMQSVSVIGTHGLTLITMLLAISPLWWRVECRACVAIWLVWGIILAWGVWHLPTHIANANTMLRVVQAAIPRSLKWDPQGRIDGIRKHIQLSLEPAKREPDFIIWPESAAPFNINSEPLLIRNLSRIAPSTGALLTGGLRHEEDRYFNSIYAITTNGIAAVYDKHHLVPFGEFVPFRDILPLDKISPGETDYSRGDGPVILEVAGTAFTPQICYEAIFADDIRYDASLLPWILNVTNDGWFGRSSGPYQHLHMVRFRAVEYGVPLVRAANTGISAVVDPYGRIVASLGLNASGVLDVALPEPRHIAGTWFSHFGDLLYMLLLLSVGISVPICRKMKR